MKMILITALLACASVVIAGETKTVLTDKGIMICRTICDEKGQNCRVICL